MTIKDYTPSEIEIKSLGIGLINNTFLDLNTHEYLVIGDINEYRNESLMDCGQQQTTYWSNISSGLKWNLLGDIRPNGIELINVSLSTNLLEKTEFTKEEWDNFGITTLQVSNYIKSGNNYYSPDIANDILPKNIKYSMIVNNSGIGINTTRNEFDKKFTSESISGIYIEQGDIYCNGTISARNIKIFDDDGLPYNLNEILRNDPEEVINNFITIMNENIKNTKFYQGWNSEYKTDTSIIQKSNIYTESYINISSGSTDTINNLHPVNIISNTSAGKIENIHIAMKNKAMSQPYIYTNSAGENVNVKEPSSLRLGIVGGSNISPAIISTTFGMPLDFHISKPSYLINKTYNNNDYIIGENDIPNYEGNNIIPDLRITEDGNIGIGCTEIEEINNKKAKLRVKGNSIFDNIYIKKNEQIVNLDDIYYKKLGNTFTAEQISGGKFNLGNFIFTEDLEIEKNIEINNNLVVNNNANISNDLTTNNLNITGIFNIISDNLTSFNCPLNFKKDIICDGRFDVNGDLFYDGYRLNGLNINNIKNLTDNGNGTFTLDGNIIGNKWQYLGNTEPLEGILKTIINTEILIIKLNGKNYGNSFIYIGNSISVVDNIFIEEYTNSSLSNLIKNKIQNLQEPYPSNYIVNISNEEINGYDFAIINENNYINVNGHYFKFTKINYIINLTDDEYSQLNTEQLLLSNYINVIDIFTNTNYYFKPTNILTHSEIEDKILLYYSFDSTNSIKPDGNNLIIPGRLGIGINDTDSYTNNNLIIKNNDINDFEILIEDNNLDEDTTINKSYIGHINIDNHINDKSLIFCTNLNLDIQKKRNIYFYSGVQTNDIISNNINPTLSIFQNNKVGINLNIDNDPKKTLHVNGDILVNNLYLNKNGTEKYANIFLHNNLSQINNTYFLNTDDTINKYFINYNSEYHIKNNILEISKGLNVINGINSLTNDISGGYYENSIRLATFRYINFDNNNLIKTAYTNANLIIGIDNLSDESKNSYIDNDTKPIMIRNLSNNNYNDTIIRLYRGKISNDNNIYKRSKFTGIDFCEWAPITGIKEKEKWFIYRNHDDKIQTTNNYPGVLQFGYTDNQYHPDKAGLEIMYRRNTNDQVDYNEEIEESDSRNYYFIFNRPKIESLPNNNTISDLKTVTIYGDIRVTGSIFCDNINNESVTTTDSTQSLRNHSIATSFDIQDDVLLEGKKLLLLYNNDKCIFGNLDSNIHNFINYNNTDNNIIFYNNQNNPITTFIKPFDITNSKNESSIELKLKFFDYENDQDGNTISSTYNDTDINNIILSLEPAPNIEFDKDNLKDFYNSIFSIKDKNNNKLISFYNQIDNNYINIGKSNNLNYNKIYTDNISLHIEDSSKYLLQLTNVSDYESSRINFHNKISDTLNNFWILEGPTNTNKFNFNYSKSENFNPTYINNVLTLTSNNLIGINNNDPNYTLDIKSINNTSLKLINNYTEIDNTLNNPNNFSYILINNNHLNVDQSYLNNDINQINNDDFKNYIKGFYLSNISTLHISQQQYDSISFTSLTINHYININKNIYFPQDISSSSPSGLVWIHSGYEIPTDVTKIAIINTELFNILNNLIIKVYQDNEIILTEIQKDDYLFPNLTHNHYILINNEYFSPKDDSGLIWIYYSQSISNTILINYDYHINILSENIPDNNIYNEKIYEGFKTSDKFIKTKKNNYNDSFILDITLNKELSHNINFNDFDIDYFKFNNNVNKNIENPNILDINNKFYLPDFSLSNTDILKFNINKEHTINQELTSNLIITISDNIYNFNINNNYNYLNNIYLNSNITNYTYELDTDNPNKINIFNLFTSNYILQDQNSLDNLDDIHTEVFNYISETIIDNYLDNQITIKTSNAIIYDDSIIVNDINFDINYLINSELNFNIDIPYSIYKDNYTFDFNSYGYDDLNNSNYYNFVSSNYLENNLDGSSEDLFVNTITSNIKDIDYNIDIFQYTFNNIVNSINKNVKIRFYNYYELYDTNSITHYLMTNIINNVPHIILNNTFTENNNTISGSSKIYSTNNGNLRFNYEEGNTDKTLMELEKNGNIKLIDGNLFVKNIFVDNILNIDTSNSIILDNTNHLGNSGFTHAVDNFNVLTNDINFESSNITFTLNGQFNDNLNIYKTGDSLNTGNNEIINIYVNNDTDVTYKNAFNIFYKDNYIISSFGNDTKTKLGIGKNKDDINYTLDVNGQLNLIANNTFNNQEPHILLNTNNRNILLGEKIYDNNLIYSDNGVLKITALNSITNFEKNLLIIDNGNITTETINADSIITNKLYDNSGNSLLSGIDNLNENEFIYAISNLHFRSSNIQFTTSNINIALYETNNNYFNINKVRSVEIDEVLNDNILNFDLFDTLPYIKNTNIIYNSITQIDNTSFITATFDNNNIIYRNIIDNATPDIESSDTSQKFVNTYGQISQILYYTFNSKSYLFVIDKTNNKINVIDYYDNVLKDFTLNNVTFGNLNVLSINNNYLYLNNDNIIYKVNIASILTNAIPNFNNIINTQITNSTIGNLDGILANFTNISSIIVDNNNNYLYVADNYSYSIRRIEISTNFTKTIAGYYTETNFSPRTGISIGDGIDTRFNNIKKIVLTNDNKFLIILDNLINLSRILIMELTTEHFFVSTLYQNDTIPINDIILDKFDNKIIYIVSNNPSNIYKLIIDDYDIFNKNNYLEFTKNCNIFSISSIPHDSINFPYYTMDNDNFDDFNHINGYVHSMSIKTNKKSTIVQFGNNDDFEKAYVGISCEPKLDTELSVNGKIDALDLNISNCIYSDDLYTKNIYTNCIKSYDSGSYGNNIEFSANLIPSYEYQYDIGSRTNNIGNIYISNQKALNIGNIKIISNNLYESDKFELLDYSDNNIGLVLNDIILNNNTNDDYIKINFDVDSTDPDNVFNFIEFNIYNNITQTTDIAFNFTNGTFETNNLTLLGNLIVNGNDSQFNEINATKLLITDTIFCDSSINFVGIGTDDPKAKLHIKSNNTGQDSLLILENKTNTWGNNDDGACIEFKTFNNVDSISISQAKILVSDHVGIDNGLIAHYKFDGDLLDSSGNGKTLSQVGTVTYNSPGVNDFPYSHYVNSTTTKSSSFTKTPDINQNVPISFAFWFYVDNNSYHTIMGYGDYKTPSIQWDFISGNKLQIFTALNNAWTVSPSVSGLSINTWYHCVYTLNNASTVVASLYLNGVLRTTASGNAGQTLRRSKNLVIGESGDGGRGFAGRIGDVRIYNRVLSQAEITSLYTTQIDDSDMANLIFQTRGYNSDTSQSTVTEKMRITHDGKVAIGTDTPNSKLDIKITDNNDGILLKNATNKNLIKMATDTNNSECFISLFDGTTNTSLIRFDNTNNSYIDIGNLGIGTKIPTHKLHVVGDTFIDGKITANELEITGSSTIIHTDEYVTESLHINSQGEDAISLKINHDSDNHDILQIFNKSDNQIFTINNEGKIAIGSETYFDKKLNIDGDIYVHGSLNGLSKSLLTNLESLDDDIIDKFTNSSNYTENVYSNVLYTSNFINNVNNSLNEFKNIDYINDPKHPIVTEYFTDGTSIKHNILNNANIYYQSSENNDEYYIVLKNNNNDNKTHYKLSYNNNSLNNILLLGGGGKGLNASIENELLLNNRINTSEELNNYDFATNNISVLTTSDNNLYYNMDKYICYRNLYNNTEHNTLIDISLELNDVFSNIKDIKVSRDDELLAVIVNNYIILYYLNNFIITNKIIIGSIHNGNTIGNNIETRFSNPLSLCISNNKKFILIADTNNNCIKKYNIIENTTEIISGPEVSNTYVSTGDINSYRYESRWISPKGIVITSDDNIAYISDHLNNKIKLLDLNTYIVTTEIESISYPTNLDISVNNNELYILTSTTNTLIDTSMIKYNINNKILDNIIIHNDMNVIDISYTKDDSSIIYITKKFFIGIPLSFHIYKLYNKNIEKNILSLPSCGGAGSVLYRENTIIPKGIYDIYVGNSGFDTEGFGGIAYKGGDGYKNYNDLNISGNYNGYNIENNYILKNNKYDNITKSAEFTQGGIGYTNINSNIFYNGTDGFKASFIENDYQTLNIPLYYGGGSGQYNIITSNIGNKGLGGGLDSIDIFDNENYYRKNILHSENNSGAGSIGGVTKKLAVYPIFDNILDDPYSSVESITNLGTNVVLWHDAQNIDGTNNSSLTNGNKVTTWYNASGSSFTTSIGTSYAPTYNGKQGLYFNGKNVYNSTINLNNYTTMNIFIVWKPNTIHYDKRWLWSQDNGGYDRTLILYNSSGTTNYVGRGQGGKENSTYTFTANTTVVVNCEYNTSGQTGGFYINNSLNTSFSSLSANGTNNTVFGAKNATASPAGNSDRGITGDMYEIVIIDRLLTTSERLNIYNYLNKKWINGGRGRKIFSTNNSFDLVDEIIIKLDFNYKINIYISSGIDRWTSEINEYNLQKGNYKLKLFNNTILANQKIVLLDNNDTIIIDTSALSFSQNIISWIDDTILHDSPYPESTNMSIYFEYDIVNNSENPTIQISDYEIIDNYVTIDDSSKGGSGIVILKYNITKEPVNYLEDKFDKRLKLLEENLLFSRINTYNDIELQYYKDDFNKLFSKAFIDQSYSGIKIIHNTNNIYNTVNKNYKYVWNISYKTTDIKNTYDNTIQTKKLKYVSNNNIFSFINNSFNKINENNYVYIHKINLEIYDDIYDPNNNAYISKLNLDITEMTPFLNISLPINDNLFIYYPFTLINPYMNNIFVKNNNYYIINDSKIIDYNIITFNYDSNINDNNITYYQFYTPYLIHIDILIIAGGGAGGSRINNLPGGGGGAGEVLITNHTLTEGTYIIKVGNGGYNQATIQDSPENGFDSGIYSINDIPIFNCKGGGSGGYQYQFQSLNTLIPPGSGGSSASAGGGGGMRQGKEDGDGGGGAGGESNNNIGGNAYTTTFFSDIVGEEDEKLIANGGNGGTNTTTIVYGDGSFIYGSGGNGASLETHIYPNQDGGWKKGNSGSKGLVIIKYTKEDVSYNSQNYYEIDNNKIRWSSANYLEQPLKLPYLCLNNDTNIYGEWQRNQYVNGNYNSTNNKLQLNGNIIYGEWLMIKFDEDVFLTDVEFLLKDSIELAEWYIGGYNNLPDNIINQDIDFLSYNFNILDKSVNKVTNTNNNTKITVNNNHNKYNTYVILVNKISANSNKLMISNIKFNVDKYDSSNSLIN